MASGSPESVSLRTRCLEAIGGGVLPTKLTYCGEAGLAYDRLARREAYRGIVMAVGDEAQATRSALPQARHCSICDLGSGNGLHAVALMRACAAAGLTVRRYLALDIAPRLLAIAEHEVRTALPEVEWSAEVWDFEEAPTTAIRRWRDGPTVITMLGLTLGNVEDPGRVLTHVRCSVEDGDVLVLGVAAAPSDPRRALAPYVSPEFTEAALAPFVKLGLDAADLAVDVWWEAGGVRAAVRARRTVRFPGSAVVLERNSRVVVLQSRRFLPGEVEVVATAAGWRVAGEPRLDAAGHMTVTLCAS